MGNTLHEPRAHSFLSIAVLQSLNTLQCILSKKSQLNEATIELAQQSFDTLQSHFPCLINNDLSINMQAIKKYMDLIPFNFSFAFGMQIGIFGGGCILQKEAIRTLKNKLNVGLIATLTTTELNCSRVFNLHTSATGGSFIDVKGDLFAYSDELEIKHYPIVDGLIPSTAIWKELEKDITETRKRGKNVYVHCWSGVQRTWTVISKYLQLHDERVKRMGKELLYFLPAHANMSKYELCFLFPKEYPDRLKLSDEILIAHLAMTYVKSPSSSIFSCSSTDFHNLHEDLIIELYIRFGRYIIRSAGNDLKMVRNALERIKRVRSECTNVIKLIETSSKYVVEKKEMNAEEKLMWKRRIFTSNKRKAMNHELGKSKKRKLQFFDYSKIKN